MDDAAPDEAALWTEAARDRLLLAARRDIGKIKLDIVELTRAMARSDRFMADTTRTLRGLMLITAIVFGAIAVRPLLSW